MYVAASKMNGTVIPVATGPSTALTAIEMLTGQRAGWRVRHVSDTDFLRDVLIKPTATRSELLDLLIVRLDEAFAGRLDNEEFRRLYDLTWCGLNNEWGACTE